MEPNSKFMFFSKIVRKNFKRNPFVRKLCKNFWTNIQRHCWKNPRTKFYAWFLFLPINNSWNSWKCFRRDAHKNLWRHFLKIPWKVRERGFFEQFLQKKSEKISTGILNNKWNSQPIQARFSKKKQSSVKFHVFREGILW